MTDFQKAIIEGIPDVLPEPKPYDPTVNHAPHRKQILTADEKKLALKNALRYFPPKHHAALIPEFKEEIIRYMHAASTTSPTRAVRLLPLCL